MAWRIECRAVHADRPIAVYLHELSEHGLLRSLVGRPKLWGQLAIATRSFARQTSSLEVSAREPMLLGLCAFGAGLAARLRGEDEAAAIEAFVPEGRWRSMPNSTNAVLEDVGARCAALTASGAISAIHYSMLEAQLTELSHAQGGCERIQTTPLPYAYALLLHRTAYLFCLILPFALATALGWWTPFLAVVVSYAFFGLDALSDELGDPFGLDDNDLPLNAIARSVERDLKASLGYREIPPPLAPSGYVLR